MTLDPKNIVLWIGVLAFGAIVVIAILAMLGKAPVSKKHTNALFTTLIIGIAAAGVAVFKGLSDSPAPVSTNKTAPDKSPPREASKEPSRRSFGVVIKPPVWLNDFPGFQIDQAPEQYSIKAGDELIIRGQSEQYIFSYSPENGKEIAQAVLRVVNGSDDNNNLKQRSAALGRYFESLVKSKTINITNEESNDQFRLIGTKPVESLHIPGPARVTFYSGEFGVTEVTRK